MLAHLSVQNLALIDSVELSLQPGMTVLTGETGAGKSILVEALLLLLGARASADVVRSGATDGSVQAQFVLPAGLADKVSGILAEQGLPPLEDTTLLLRRMISREGRHRQSINGALCTVAQLKQVAEPLIDFTGQHAHQQLLRPGAALQLLDGFADHEALLAQMKTAFDTARSAAAELAELSQKEAEKERRLDVLRFYLEEIEDLDPRAGEDEELVLEQKRLQNAGRLRDAVGEAHALLADGDNDALTRAQQALQTLQRATRDDPTLVAVAQTLQEAVALLDDAARTLQRQSEVEDNPERLQTVEDRLDALKRVMRKHGGDLASVLAARHKLTTERQTLETATQRIAELEGDLSASLAQAVSVAGTLTTRRRAASKRLAVAIAAELPALGMASAQVEVRIEATAPADGPLRRPEGAALLSTGADRVEMLFSANAGEALQPLAKVASGGELSRVLLGLKRVLLAKDPVPVSVFDEVDAGVGGAVGDAIGEKLEAISAEGGGFRQVLCITHLAQIAARARNHLVVEKAIEGGRTLSRVRVLGDEDRITELARMLGGKEITPATLQHARDMWGRARMAAPAVGRKKKSA